MSKLMISSDLHLGHKAICKYRKDFKSSEEHNEILFDNLASNVNKADTLYLLGDVAFDKYWLDKVSKINCKHKKLICGNHCISLDTEVLTADGWKYAKDINMEDRVASVNLNSGVLNYALPLDVFEKEATPMYSVKGTYVDQLVTEGHKCIIDGERVLVSSLEDKISADRVMYGGIVKNTCTLTAEEVSIITWIVCDGTIVHRSENNKRVQFKLSKTRKIDALETLLGKLNLKYTKREATLSCNNKLQPYYICLYGNEARYLVDLVGGKKEYPPSFKNLSGELFKVFLSTLADTDGSKDRERLEVATIQQSQADTLQLMAIHNNTPCYITTRDPSSGFKNGKRQFIVTFHTNNCRKTRDVRVEALSLELPTVGIDTKDTTIVVRRSGKVSVTGNCRDHHSMLDLCNAFDSVDALLSKRNIWWSHCPIHPQELRGRILNIHGHTHNHFVKKCIESCGEMWYENDPLYFNACVEHTDWKPISFAEIMARVND